MSSRLRQSRKSSSRISGRAVSVATSETVTRFLSETEIKTKATPARGHDDVQGRRLQSCADLAETTRRYLLIRFATESPVSAKEAITDFTALVEKNTPLVRARPC